MKKTKITINLRIDDFTETKQIERELRRFLVYNFNKGGEAELKIEVEDDNSNKVL